LETVKNIAAILGAILSLSAVITLCCKPIKLYIASALKKYQNEQDDKVQQNTLKATLKRIENKLDATVAYTTEACRGEIKNMFYRYMENKTLPYYEKMHMLQIEDIYVNKLQKNHYTKGLIDEMKTWSVDYTGVDSQDVN
jgi:hypothetical protein